MHKTYLIKYSLGFFMLPGTLDISFSRLRLFPVIFNGRIWICTAIRRLYTKRTSRSLCSTSVQRWVVKQTQSTYESTLAKKCAKMLCCFLDFLAESTYLTPTTQYTALDKNEELQDCVKAFNPSRPTFYVMALYS